MATVSVNYMTSDLTLYLVILSQDGLSAWKPSTSEWIALSSVASANYYSTYGVDLTEAQSSDSVGAAVYNATFPSGITNAGDYVCRLHQHSDGSLANDRCLGEIVYCWDGSDQVQIADIKNAANAAAAILDEANGVETGKTVRDTLRIIAAVIAGKVSGAGTGTETFRSLDDSADRAVVNADASGNRTQVTYP